MGYFEQMMHVVMPQIKKIIIPHPHYRLVLRGVGGYRNASDLMSCKDNSLTGERILMKLYTVAIYYLRICMK